MAAGRYVVPFHVLERFPNETVDVLRLGACANALNSVAALAALTRSAGVGKARDTLQVSLLLLSYLKEAADILDQKRLWELVTKAVEAGFELPQPLERYRELFSRGRKSIYREYLHDARNQKGFHIGRDHFEEWRRTIQAPELAIWQRDSDSPLDWAFTLSMQIQSFYGPKLGGSYTISKVIGLAPHLVFLVEALCAGLMVDAERDFRVGWQPTRHFRVRIEYTFRDGRPPLTEWDQVTVQGQRIGGSSIAPLRAKFLARAGAVTIEKKTGYILNPANGALVQFSAPGVAAFVWLAEEIQDDPQRGDGELLSQFANMAMWGERQALQSLKLIEAVKSGNADAVGAESLQTEFADSLKFWQNQKAAADYFIKLQRPDGSPRKASDEGNP